MPTDSAEFIQGSNITVDQKRSFPGYDHAEMKNGLSINHSFPLFDTLRADLNSIYTNGSAIIATEYFIDNDPGEGNGIGMSLSGLPSETINIPNISTSTLTIGVHNFYIRMQNEDGVWGTPRKIIFEVTGNKYISEAEYFIDSDPGEGNGTALVAWDSNFDFAVEDIEGTVDTSNLNIGLHTLHVRAKDSEGHWGTPREFKFEVSDSLNITAYIAGAEFYVDNGTGSGNGTALNASDGSFDSVIEDIDGTLDTSTLNIGFYTLYVSTLDSYLRWGIPASVTFEVVDASANYRVSGSGMNYPIPRFRASMALDVRTSSLTTSRLKYYYTRQRVRLVSTAITGLSVVGATATITGEGTVNGTAGYTFTATVIDGTPDEMGIDIYNPDSSLYFSAAPEAISRGQFSIVEE